MFYSLFFSIKEILSFPHISSIVHKRFVYLNLKLPNAFLGFTLDLDTKDFDPEDTHLSQCRILHFCYLRFSIGPRIQHRRVCISFSLGMLTGRCAISKSRFQFRSPFYREKRKLERGRRRITRIA